MDLCGQGNAIVLPAERDHNQVLQECLFWRQKFANLQLKKVHALFRRLRLKITFRRRYALNPSATTTTTTTATTTATTIA